MSRVISLLACHLYSSLYSETESQTLFPGLQVTVCSGLRETCSPDGHALKHLVLSVTVWERYGTSTECSLAGGSASLGTGLRVYSLPHFLFFSHTHPAPSLSSLSPTLPPPVCRWHVSVQLPGLLPRCPGCFVFLP